MAEKSTCCATQQCAADAAVVLPRRCVLSCLGMVLRLLIPMPSRRRCLLWDRILLLMLGTGGVRTSLVGIVVWLLVRRLLLVVLLGWLHKLACWCELTRRWRIRALLRRSLLVSPLRVWWIGIRVAGLERKGKGQQVAQMRGRSQTCC